MEPEESIKQLGPAGSPVPSLATQSPLEAFVDLGQLAIVALLLELLLFEGTEVVALVRLGAIAAILVAVLKSQGWLVLLVLQAGLFMREPRRPEMELGWVPVLFCLASLAVVAYTYLGRSFRRRVSRYWVSNIQLALVLAQPNHPQTQPDVSRPGDARPGDARPGAARFVASQFLVWTSVVLVAMFALLRLPITTGARSDWLRSSIENDFTVWPGATLLVLSLLLVIAFMEMGWRQMTRAQANLYLRSVFMVEHYRDFRMIVLRRLKRKRLAANSGEPSKQLVERLVASPPREPISM